MREKIYAILSSVIIGFDSYSGHDLVRDGMVDSMDLLEIISEIEDEFLIEIPAEKMVFDNFATIDNIEKLVVEIQKEMCEGTDGI